jgi:geranyl diphosphate synthase
MATAVEHLVTGETMQISTSREQRRRFNIFLYTMRLVARQMI